MPPRRSPFARLREAREARAMSLVDLERKSGVARSLIADYEAGTRLPRPETAVRLMNALGILPSFFLAEEPAPEPAPIFMRHFRSKAGAKQMKAVHRQLPWVRTLVGAVEEYVDFPEVNLPNFHPPSDPRQITNESIESAATALRKHWGLGDGVIRDIIKLVENNGCIVIPEIVPCAAIDAFSQWTRIGRPFIIANSPLLSGVRWRVDIAHELGHLVMHRMLDRRFIETNPATHKLIEDQAFRFAGAFLMPASTFQSSVQYVALDSLLLAKTHWHIAVQAMLHRAQDLGMVDMDAAQRLWKNLSRRGWRKREPLDDQMPAEQPQLLANAVRAISDDGERHLDELCMRTGLSGADIARYCGLAEKELFVTERALPRIRGKNDLEIAR